MADAEAVNPEIIDDAALAQEAAHPKRPTIEIKVYAPFKVYYEGVGYSLSAVNQTGPFDILPRHHNFLCMLVPCNLKIQTPDGEKVIKISRALMHVKADRVVVFVDV
jgi:F0F1-type ATP synthase epsilon subunit